MTKKEIIQNTKPFAYYSGYSGIELHHIEYGIDDHVYFIAGTRTANKSYHKSKVYFNLNGDSYIKFNGNRIPLGECIMMN
jgi:hypothetical protein